MQDIRERTEAKRQAIIDNLLHCIENNPKIWEKGWYSVTDSPLNGKSNNKYQGFNALYLSILASIKGYNDPRWMTFNQVKEMGGYVNAGEKASEIFFYQLYDKNTKKEFDEKTVEGMTPEERKKYIDTNTYRPIKFYQVFNAAQCKGLPAYDKPQMSSEEQSRQINLIENVIKNSAAPISYDGGSRAYYNTKTDSIHLPKVSDFKTMQDYYATALHEIAHSTGHSSRLNRDFTGGFGSENYAVEELRAELSSVFMQLDLGLQLEGQHIENHGAYLSSWLKAVKDDKNILFKTIKDAEKISDYVVENYANKEEQKEVLNTNASFSKQIDDVLSGIDTESTHLRVMGVPFILREVGASNSDVYIVASHLKSILSKDTSNPHNHGLDVDIIKQLPELLADPVFVMDSLTRDDSVVVVTTATNNNAEPIIAAVRFNGKAFDNTIEITNANVITSVYGKEKFNNFIRNNVDNGTILYWNKEKSQDLLKIPGLQLPNNLSILASNTIIRKAKAFVNSFSQKNQNDTKSATEIANNTNKELEKFTEPYCSYLAEQGDNPDIIYFKRIGDFYEVMGENAKIIAEELDLTLTSRKIGQEERVPMCGIPYHALDNYLKKLNDRYTADIKENGMYLASIKTQEKQSQQVEQAKQVGQVEQAKQVGQAEQVEYLKIDIPKEQYGGEYGKSVMIKMPPGSEYSSFVFFAPKNFVKQQNLNGDYILTVKNTSLCELKNDGMSVELTGKELSTAIAGKEVGKSAKRVAPSHRTLNNLERINSNIPDEMKNKPNWCVYKARWNSEKGKKDKYIYSPILGLDEKGKLQWASIDKPDTWSTFDRALEFAKENNCEGLVFALDGSGISCIDLDKAIAKNGFLNGKPTDLKDGELNDVAKKIVPNMSDTYIEKSTSGNGFHIFVKDDILKGNHYKNRAELEKGDEIEVYDNKRFISMTGDCDSKKDLTQCPQETMSYIRETLGKKQTVNVENYNRSSSFNKSDAEVIACIEKSKKGSVFKQLYNGADITGDNSRNDFMLMNILAYFTDCDADQMERIFKSSGLYRPQKQDGYYKTTINSAIGSLYQRPSFGSNKPFGKAGGKKNNNSK